MQWYDHGLAIARLSVRFPPSAKSNPDDLMMSPNRTKHCVYGYMSYYMFIIDLIIDTVSSETCDQI